MAGIRRAAFVALLASVLVAAPASGVVAQDEDGGGIAPASMGQCGASTFCLWSGSLYSGSFAGTASTSLVNLPFVGAQSVWNRASKSALVYSGLNGTGTATCVTPGTQSGSVSIPARSMRVLTTATTC